MESTIFDNIEAKALVSAPFDRIEKMRALNKEFPSDVKPEDGAYGVKEIDKGNGAIEKQFRDGNRNLVKEYYQDGKLQRISKKVNGAIELTRFDDVGTAYIKEVAVREGHVIASRSMELTPNTIIKKGDFTAITDDLGRVIKAEIDDLKIQPGRSYMSNKIRDDSYRTNDQRGHLIADIFGGPSSKENVVPQLSEVNQSQIKQVENEIRRLKESGHKVSYGWKVNYGETGNRPTSFEPTIKVDGKIYELKGELAQYRKIYNDNYGKVEKAKVSAKEKISASTNKGMVPGVELTPNELGIKQGAEAAKITAIISTVDNVQGYMNGEISGYEMAGNIASETGKAGIIGYGAGYVSEGISSAMSASSKELIRSLGRANVPAAVVAFGVDTYDSVIDYAKGKIDTVELAYDLGEGASGVAGGIAGAELGAAAGTAIVPGAGTVVGGVVGGVVGYTVTTEAYKTAVEIGSEVIDVIGETAKEIGNATVDAIKEYAPDAIDFFKESLNTYSELNNLPFGY